MNLHEKIGTAGAVAGLVVGGAVALLDPLNKTGLGHGALYAAGGFWGSYALSHAYSYYTTPRDTAKRLASSIVEIVKFIFAVAGVLLMGAAFLAFIALMLSISVLGIFPPIISASPTVVLLVIILVVLAVGLANLTDAVNRSNSHRNSYDDSNY